MWISSHIISNPIYNLNTIHYNEMISITSGRNL